MSKLLLIALLSASGVTAGQPTAPGSDDHTRLADILSPRCATPVGVCLVPPQPVGSPCLCGEIAGTVIP